MKKAKVIKKSDIQECWVCEGKKKPCKVCKNTGKWEETHYIISDGKSACDSDNIG